MNETSTSAASRAPIGPSACRKMEETTRLVLVYPSTATATAARSPWGPDQARLHHSSPGAPPVVARDLGSAADQPPLPSSTLSSTAEVFLFARGGPTPVSLCQFRRADFNRSDAVMSLVCHVDVPCFRTESGRWNPQADGSTVAIEFSSEKGRPSRRGSRHAPNRRFDGGKLTEVIRFA